MQMRPSLGQPSPAGADQKCRDSFVTAPLKCAVMLLFTLILAAHNSERATQSTTTARARRVLDELVANPANAVPDGILNRTKCVVVLPFLAGSHRTASESQGFASCRESADHWSAPIFVRFTGLKDKTVENADILIFIMSERGKQALISDVLKVGALHSSRPGFLVRQTAVISDADISSDALTYVRRQGLLIGAAVTGNVRVDASSAAFRGDQSDLRNLKAGVPLKDPFVASVTSFFNTITPTGIVIHHSGTIPANNRLPASENEIDKFHTNRGFSILCFGQLYHVAYHYLIFPDGSIKQGRPERCEGAHALGYNSYLGISLVGDFSSVDNAGGRKQLRTPTRQQMTSLIGLCRELIHRYRIPMQRVVRHSDVASTRCPGDRFPFTEFLRQLQRSSS